MHAEGLGMLKYTAAGRSQCMSEVSKMKRTRWRALVDHFRELERNLGQDNDRVTLRRIASAVSNGGFGWKM
jgi:hypothetical protein